jgi:hypothetical protein
VRYLRTEGCPWVDRACLAALRRGDRDLFLWALEHAFDTDCGDFPYYCWEAVIDTGIEMATWFHELQLCRADGYDLHHAVYLGHVHICRYMTDVMHCDLNHFSTENCAAGSDNPEICEWLLEINYVFDMDLLAEEAAGRGKLAVLQWAVERGADLTSELFERATRSGQLAAVQYLDSQGCDWGDVDGVRIQAALGGSVEVLTYVCDRLEHAGLITQPTLLTDMLNAAGGLDELKAAKWLRQRGAEWPPVLRFVRADEYGDERVYEWAYEVLDWARAEGCTAPTSSTASSSTA